MPNTHRPKAKRDGLITKELHGELLIYDTTTHRAHCLNSAAVAIWQLCDGNRSVEQIARELKSRNDALWPLSDGKPTVEQREGEEVVWLGLEELEKNELLEVAAPIPSGVHGIDRRAMLQRLGLAAAVALPIVVSLIAPTAAQAGTPANDPGSEPQNPEEER